MEKIVKGDEVIVLTGKDKGKRGTVLARVSESLVQVEGINAVKKHVKPNPMRNQPGGITDKFMPLHISNVAVFNPATGKGARVSIKEVDGKKVRVYAGTDTPVGKKA